MDVSRKINKEDALHISKDTLHRLSSTRPEHKQPRRKFDKTNQDCLNEQNNKKMTFEDNIHLGTMENEFFNMLRVPDVPKTGLVSTEGPPSFFEKDLDKFQSKFQQAVSTRAAFKDTLNSLGQTTIVGTANQNATRIGARRRNSRQSANTFCNVDFNYTGNTASVQHLISHARGPNNHAPSDLNFELNLRTWKVKKEGVPI